MTNQQNQYYIIKNKKKRVAVQQHNSRVTSLDLSRESGGKMNGLTWQCVSSLLPPPLIHSRNEAKHCRIILAFRFVSDFIALLDTVAVKALSFTPAGAFMPSGSGPLFNTSVPHWHTHAHNMASRHDTLVLCSTPT